MTSTPSSGPEDAAVAKPQLRNAMRDERARTTYRASVEAGAPLTRRQLGRLFGQSRDWGRDRIEEVRTETLAAAGVPPEFCTDGSQHEHDPQAHVEPIAKLGRHATSGRVIAWLAFAVGIATSVAANVMHARITSATSAAWIGAAFWPIALLLAVEVLTRVEWPAEPRWNAIARYGGTGLVTTVAAILSYRHMSGLLTAWGEDALSARLGPLAVDGLMITATAALLASSEQEGSPTVRSREPALLSSCRRGRPHREGSK